MDLNFFFFRKYFAESKNYQHQVFIIPLAPNEEITVN
jgi:hypothetical protein